MHSITNFAVLEGESKHESSAKQQQAAKFVSDILKKLALTASFSTLNHHIFTYFVQRGSFLGSCCHLNLKEAFKVKNLVPMTMHHSRCHWSRALYQALGRILMRKRPLLSVSDLICLLSRTITMTITITKTIIMTMTITRKMTITMPKCGVTNSNIFKIVRLLRKKQDRGLGKIKNASQPKISLSGEIVAMRYSFSYDYW